uniref:Uncharacterized protein n=1 Tax=Sphaerodactylus townsendi TaxID=933632 RepID=A0ACB8EUN5_9SAUR
MQKTPRLTPTDEDCRHTLINEETNLISLETHQVQEVEMDWRITKVLEGSMPRLTPGKSWAKELEEVVLVSSTAPAKNSNVSEVPNDDNDHLSLRNDLLEGSNSFMMNDHTKVVKRPEEFTIKPSKPMDLQGTQRTITCNVDFIPVASIPSIILHSADNANKSLREEQPSITLEPAPQCSDLDLVGNNTKDLICGTTREAANGCVKNLEMNIETMPVED